jgi:protease PrsW
MRSNSHQAVWRLPVFATCVLLTLWLYVGTVLLGLLRNVALLPVWVVLGSVAVPSGILLLILRGRGQGHRTSSRTMVRTITPGYLLLAATAGGIVAIVIGGTLDALIQPTVPAGAIDDRVFLLVGFIEEAAKLGAVLTFGARLRTKSVREGLLLGAAVGLGFAAFEDMGYAMAPFLDHPFSSALLVHSGQIQLLRQLLTPLGHPLWSALLGAAVFASVRQGRYQLRPLAILAYLAVAVTHGAWDGAVVLGPRVLGNVGYVAAHCVVWCLTVVGIVVVFRILRNPVLKSTVPAGTTAIGDPRNWSSRTGVWPSAGAGKTAHCAQSAGDTVAPR